MLLTTAPIFNLGIFFGELFSFFVPSTVVSLFNLGLLFGQTFLIFLVPQRESKIGFDSHTKWFSHLEVLPPYTVKYFSILQTATD